jgi:epoxide hydrolase-like predicted phosphatase
MLDVSIQAFIFDFGGVFTRSDVVATWLREYDAQLGLAPGTLLNTLYSGETWEMASTGHITREVFWERAGVSFEARLPAEFGRLRQGLFHVEPINEGMVALARRLRTRYRLALCSNALVDLQEVLAERPDIRELFDALIISWVAGLRKPDPTILSLSAERLGLPISACLLIDDKPRNTNVALALGMQAIVFESVEQLEQELNARRLL